MVKPFYRNIRLLILTIVMILAWGFSSFQSLPRQEDPELVSRVAVVQTAYPGANAERVEALVTEVIEAELSELEEINVMESDSRVGFSTISVELASAIDDAQPVWSKVRDQLDDAAAMLPSGASEPELNETEIKAYTVIASLTWNLPTEPNYAVLRRYGEELALRLRGVVGTEEVELFGDPNEEIVAEVNAPDLAAIGLSTQELADLIHASDAKVTAGQLRSPQQNLAIEVQSELKTLEQIRQIPIQTDGGQFTRLGDIAQVRRSIQQPMTDLAIVGGKPAVVAGVLMESGLRIDYWATEVRAILTDFESRLPEGVSLDIIFDQSAYVETRIDNLISNLVIGSGLVAAVTLVTMGWRSALVVGAALPITSLAMFGWMTVFDIPIHQMSVSGLIIALGLLIDNAIIAVDEIQVEMQRGAKTIEAVTRTVDYLKVPLLASTVTTVMTFLPIYLVPGAPGEFVGSLGLSVIMALISSLVLSLTVIAALAGRILGRSQTKAQQLNNLQQTGPVAAFQRFLLRPGAWWTEGFTSPLLARPYRWTLEWTMAKPLLAIALTLIVPLIGFLSAKTLDQQFFPLVSRDQLQIEVEFAPQIAISQTRDQMLQARQVILTHPNIEDVHWFIGESAPKFYYNFTGNRENQPHYAQALVQLDTDQAVETIVQDLQAQLDETFPAARILVRQLEQGPPFDAPIELRIYGPNIEELRRLGVEARRILTSVPNVVYVRDDLTEALPKLGLTIDEEQAQQSGLSNTAIAQQLDAYLEGSVGGSVLEATENLPVRVRIANADRTDLSQIASLDLRPEGAVDDLNFRSTHALGEFTLVPELANIARRNEQRVNVVQGYIAAGVLPSVVLKDFQQKLETANFELTPGYWLEYGGEQAEQSRAVGDLLQYAPLIALAMIIALVLSLGSFRQAGIVAMVAISSVGMALFSLKLFGAVMGFMAIVGAMGLVGIAINDTVMVLSALNTHPRASRGDRRAIIEVVLNATRHVVTTTVTTIAGFVPLLINGGPFWRSLSIAIAGGITGSSVMALYFAPAIYALIYRRRRKQLPTIPIDFQPDFSPLNLGANGLASSGASGTD